MTQLVERWRNASRRQKGVAIAALVYLIYALAVYFAGSAYLQKTLVTELSAATGRTVQLERAVIDPTGLAVTLEGFAFEDPGGGDFVAFDRLYVDFELSSLLRLSWHFDEVELDAPRIRVSQTGPGAFNFDDLLALGADTPPTEDEAPAGMPALSIGELKLADGDFRFLDLTRGETQELVLDDLNFEILDFSTRSDGENGNQYALAIASPDGGRFEWSGRLTVEPLILDGRLELAGLALPQFADFYQDRLRFSLLGGELDIATNYRLDMSADSPVVQLSEGAITLADLQVRQPALDEDTLVVPSLALTGIALDTATESVRVAEVALADAAVLARLTDAGMDLATVFMPLPLIETDSGDASIGADADETQTASDDQGDAPAQNAVAGDAGPAPDAAVEAEDSAAVAEVEGADSGWRARVDRIAITGMGFTLSDETLAQPAQLAASDLTLTLTNLLWGEAGEFVWDGSLLLGEGDSVLLSGTGTLLPLQLTARVSSDALSLLPLEPWLRDQARMDLVSGTSAFDVTFSLTEEGPDAAIGVTLEAGVSDLVLNELDDQPLLSLSSAAVDRVAVDVTGNAVDIGTVKVAGLKLSSRVDEQGQHTGDRVVVPVEAPVHVGETPEWRIRLKALELDDGEVLFADRSLATPFTIGLHRLAVSLQDVDTASTSPSKLTVSADVDRYAPLRISGDLKLAADDPYSDLQIVLQNYEMTSLTPFTGLYVGHTVSSGQLDFDTRLELDGTLLDSMTRLQADNFFLGDKVESDEAIKAPIKLGLAVLRNKAGEIKLPIKASGDLSDPSVSVSGIILKALGNVLVKAATSPFSALAALGGGESLENILFTPGDSALNADAQASLMQLADILNDRPALNVALAGSVDDSDRRALAAVKLNDQLWRGDWPGLATAAADADFQSRVLKRQRDELGSAATLDESMSASERARIATDAYDALMNARKAAIADEVLAEIATERASLAKAYLVEQLGVDGGRIFLQGNAMADREPVAGVQLGLDL